MSHPESDHIDYYCADHSPKPILRHPLPSPSIFLGKCVKKAFPGIDDLGKDRIEHMWVQVTGIADGVLIGQLANHPIWKCGYALGDIVSVALTEVEDVATFGEECTS